MRPKSEGTEASPWDINAEEEGVFAERVCTAARMILKRFTDLNLKEYCWIDQDLEGCRMMVENAKEQLGADEQKICGQAVRWAKEVFPLRLAAMDIQIREGIPDKEICMQFRVSGELVREHRRRME